MLKRHIFYIIIQITLLTLCLGVWIYSTKFYHGRGNVKLVDIPVHEVHFHKYMQKYKKSYARMQEYQTRLANFKASLKRIAQLNQQGGPTIYGLTKFSDMTEEEFRDKMLMKPTLSGYGKECHSWGAADCLSITDDRKSHHKNASISVKKSDIPQQFDWRNNNMSRRVIGPVLDQKMCKACWAISVVGIMESQMVIEDLMMYRRLSSQELTDCSKTTERCGGGNVALAMKFLCHDHLAITWEDNYPLTLVNESCNDSALKRSQSGVVVKSFDVDCDVDAHRIAEHITNGPVTAAVNSWSWQNYLGGTIQYNCRGDDYNALNHVVQLVGYDFTADPPFFIVKNSWGVDYGIQGYMKIAMGDFVCGIGRQIGYLTVAIKK